MRFAKFFIISSFFLIFWSFPALAQSECKPVTDGTDWISMFPRMLEKLSILTRTDKEYKETLGDIIELTNKSATTLISCEKLDKYRNYLRSIPPIQQREKHPITYNLSLGLIWYLVSRDKNYCDEQLSCSTSYYHLKIAYDNIEKIDRWDREYGLLKDICQERGIKIDKVFIEKFYTQTKNCKCKIEVVAKDSLGQKITEVKRYVKNNGSISFILDIKSESEIDFSKTEILFDNEGNNKYLHYKSQFEHATSNHELSLYMEIREGIKNIAFKFYSKDLNCNKEVLGKLTLGIKNVSTPINPRFMINNAKSLSDKITQYMTDANLEQAKGLIEVIGDTPFNLMTIKVDPLSHSVYQDDYIQGEWNDSQVNQLILVINKALVSWMAEKYFGGDEAKLYTDGVVIDGGILGETDPASFGKVYNGKDITFSYCESNESAVNIMNNLTNYCRDNKCRKNMTLRNGDFMNNNTQLGFLRAYTVLERFIDTYKGADFKDLFCIVTKSNSDWAGNGRTQRRIYLVFNIKII